MKVLFLIITILFSFSVLADCCNFEVEGVSVEKCASVGAADHCDDEGTDHEDAPEHCHCSPVNHIKFISSERSVCFAPVIFTRNTIPSDCADLQSTFENSIFHPPIV